MKKSKLCNYIASLLICIVIIIAIPLVIPKLFGYQIYGVLSGSMEPEYPVGSVIYVEDIAPANIHVKDVITFKMSAQSDVVATHRVVSINSEENSFITKGDANKENDSASVSFQRVLGKAIFCLPLFGYISLFIQSTIGILTTIILIASIFILWILADKLKKKEGKGDS